MKDWAGGHSLYHAREVGTEKVLTVAKLPFSCPFTLYIPMIQNPVYKYISPTYDPYIATGVITTMAPPLADLSNGLWIGNRRTTTGIQLFGDNEQGLYEPLSKLLVSPLISIIVVPYITPIKEFRL